MGTGKGSALPFTKEWELRMAKALIPGLWCLAPPALRAVDFNLLLSSCGELKVVYKHLAY